MMSTSPCLQLDSKNELYHHCPVCESDQFDLQTLGTDGRFISQVCSVCGLICRVVLGPESLPMEARMSEWASVFVHD